MKDATMRDEVGHFSLDAYEELMELVFAYTAAAQDFGFTHKMNNRFTSLSMNASFLKQALENKDYEKATAKTQQVSESINGLIELTQNLMNTDLIPTESQDIAFPAIIAQTIEELHELPTFRDLELQMDFCSEVIHTRVNPGVIRMILYAYLKHAKRYVIEGPILISTSIDNSTMQYILKTDVKQILEGPEKLTTESSLTFPSAGEMPLRYLARVVRNVSPRFEMIHRAERPLSFELKIKLPVS